MKRGRAWIAAVAIFVSLTLALSACSGVKGLQSSTTGAPTMQSETSVQADQQADEVDRLLQDLENNLRSTDTLPDATLLNR
jgi:hypothetical protein